MSQNQSPETKRLWIIVWMLFAFLMMFILVAMEATFENIKWHRVSQTSFFLSDGKTSIKVINLSGKNFQDFVDAFEDDDFELTSTLDSEVKITCNINAGDRTRMYYDTKLTCSNTGSFVDSRMFFVSNYQDSDDYIENILKNLRRASQEVGGK